ncbi:MAG TPA: hypothetical protein VF133_07100 [Terriglobales bacterium]
MHGEKREEWKRLCELAADEQEPDKLMQVVKRLNELLEEKEERLKQQRAEQQLRKSQFAHATSSPL